MSFFSGSFQNLSERKRRAAAEKQRFDNDMEELPQVWLTSNEVQWDPKVLDSDDCVTVPSCWDGILEFLRADNNDKSLKNSTHLIHM